MDVFYSYRAKELYPYWLDYHQCSEYKDEQRYTVHYCHTSYPFRARFYVRIGSFYVCYPYLSINIDRNINDLRVIRQSIYQWI